jgi:uncharacterized cupredoxin-like copper-binding protein
MAVLLSGALATGCVSRDARMPSDSSRPAGQAGKPALVGVVLREFEFEPRPLKARAGNVRFLLMNRGRGDHDFAIPSLEGSEIDARRIVRPGQNMTVELELRPGVYRAICRLPGHLDAGMVVTVEVSP